MTWLRDRLCMCPNCGKLYAFSEPLSINFSGWRQWSDGWGDGPLYSLATSLRGCPCGTLFWPHGAAFKVHDPDLSEIVEANLERVCNEAAEPTSWMHRYIRRAFSIRKLNFVGIPSRTHPLILPAKISRLFNVLTCSEPAFDLKTEIEIRQWLWWGWNHDSRNLNIKLDMASGASVAEREENLRRLLSLLKDAMEPNWLMIGDAFRQLGEFSSAVCAYQRMDQEDAKIHLIGLANRHFRECVEINGR